MHRQRPFRSVAYVFRWADFLGHVEKLAKAFASMSLRSLVQLTFPSTAHDR